MSCLPQAKGRPRPIRAYGEGSCSARASSGQLLLGDVIGSAIQAGSPGATQTTTVGDLNLEMVREVVDQYEKEEAALGLDASI
jgi:hypothetical protein